MTKERRRHQRKSQQLVVRVRLESIEEFVDEYARDVSISGMSLKIDQPVQVGARLYVEFRLAAGKPLIAVFCEVKWVRDSNGKYVVGVEFLDLDEAGKRTLKEILTYIDERRKFKRVNTGYRIELSAKSLKEFGQAYAKDLSAGGLQIISDTELSVNDEVNLTFGIDDAEDIRVRARVCWCEPRSNGFAVGLEFSTIDVETRIRIERAVKLAQS